MNSFFPKKGSLLLSLTMLGGVAQAQTPVASPVTTADPINIKISPENQNKLDEARILMRTVRLWDVPVDWKETSATTADLAARARKSLGTKAPAIEVRSKDSNRSTFTLEKAPLGPTLWALADLANVSVWVFPGRLVLAPKSSLTSAEKTTIKDGLGGEWQGNLQTRGVRWSPMSALDRISATIVDIEIKARLAAKGITTPVPQPPPSTISTGASRVISMPGEEPAPYTLLFSEFSPQVQEVIKDLYDERYPLMGARIGMPQTLPASTVVGFNDTRPDLFQMTLRDPNAEKPYQRELGRWLVSVAPPLTTAPAPK